MPRITGLTIEDIRFPTSRELDGSDAMNPDPDYSSAYVVLHTDAPPLEGHGSSFTIGRGNEIVCAAIRAHEHLVVGRNLADDIRRLTIIREEIGWERKLMVDANQVWDVPQAIGWMQELARFQPWWIEEPTSPDDVLGHAAIARAMEPFGIGVATGEHGMNRILFKQLMQARAIAFCQIDSCRLGGVNENLAVLLLAAKFGVPVCPHAGGVGLCEFVQHLSMVDFISVSGTWEGRVCEFVDHLHEHFIDPCSVKHGRYLAPQLPGYSTEMVPASRATFAYPQGAAWQR